MLSLDCIPQYFHPKEILLCLFVLVCSGLSAQNFQGQALEISLLAGRVLPHTDETSFEIKENSIGLQVNWQWQTQGKKEWQRLRGFPLFGLSFLYFDLGERALLGHAVGILPNLTIPFHRRGKWRGYFHIGSGLAWLSEYYDPIHNPVNNAIGSRLNNATLLKWGIHYAPSNRLALQAGFGLMHFSNGGAQLPNFGINIPVLTLACRYFPSALAKADDRTSHLTKKRLQKWSRSLSYGMAFREGYTLGGPRYPVYLGAFSLNYFSNRINKMAIGLEYEYHKADYAFGLHTYTFHTHEEAKRAASRLAFSLSNEFLFGPLAIHLLTGIYLGNFSLSKPYPFYIKLSPRYYFPKLGTKNQQFFVAISLKTHLFRAEYIALGAGIDF